ncbi:MAG: class I SAM-dependent methyltransferase, partial [Bacteroidetes bacterium]|nr:class I SAM-dependent methyltransferase [Bacteroidota bacterium]
MIKEDVDIRDTKSIEEIVDCILTKTYGDEPKNLINYLDSLPQDKAHDYLRSMCVPFLFHASESIYKLSEEPINLYTEKLKELRVLIKSLVDQKNFNNFFDASQEHSSFEDYQSEVKQHTGNHYGNLFKNFDNKSYFEEAKNLLETRLVRNNINLDYGKLSVLDQGCGGGRYTVAWSLLGAAKCTGLDFSEVGLEDAKYRCQLANINNVDFVKGSVLDMPFEDNSFDIVYSNGVLHHTEDWKKGISEQMRVMKPGGWGWQYLIENPGGIFWDNYEILRAITRNLNKKYAQTVLQSLGLPGNRIFYMLDHVMVPINTRLTPEELVTELEKNGAKNIVRL